MSERAIRLGGAQLALPPSHRDAQDAAMAAWTGHSAASEVPAIEAAPATAAIMAAELGRDAAWQAGEVLAFTAIARNYVVS